MFIFASFSTDFEVHRNWLAITHSLPIKQWYYDESSPNSTLDYPPLFALFEYLMSRILALALAFLRMYNPQHAYVTVLSTMLDVKNGVGYASMDAIWIHRATVILSDIVLYCALERFKKMWMQIYKNESLSAYFTLSIFCAPGLIMVDRMLKFLVYNLPVDVHFQYNGFLFGVFVYSLCYVQEVRNCSRK